MALNLAARATRLLVNSGVRNQKITLRTNLRCMSAAAAFSYPDSLASHAETKVTTLPNGLRVATENTGHPSATVGVWIDSGSRNETAANNGVAHFLEHMAFKGTASRSQSDIELEIENMGGMLNAYTSREMTVYYAMVAKQDVGKAVGILGDILQNSSLPEQMIEAERKVILREMEEVENIPEEVVFDHLHSVAYQGTALSRTILGPTENILSLKKQDLADYIKNNYSADRIVICGAGGVDHDELVKLAESTFSKFPATAANLVPDAARYTGSEVRVFDDDMPLGYVAVAYEGVGWTHPNFFALQVASTMVGSWNKTIGGSKNMSSPLAQIVSNEGLAHSYMSFTTCYSDTGLWGAYYAAPSTSVDDCLFEIQSEWMRIVQNAGDNEVERAKQQLKTSLMGGMDSTSQLCEEIGRQMLTLGRRMSPQEISARIDAVDAATVRKVLGETIYDRCPVVAGLGAIEALPDYNRIRSGNVWQRL